MRLSCSLRCPKSIKARLTCNTLLHVHVNVSSGAVKPGLGSDVFEKFEYSRGEQLSDIVFAIRKSYMEDFER